MIYGAVARVGGRRQAAPRRTRSRQGLHYRMVHDVMDPAAAIVSTASNVREQRKPSHPPRASHRGLVFALATPGFARHLSQAAEVERARDLRARALQ